MMPPEREPAPDAPAAEPPPPEASAPAPDDDAAGPAITAARPDKLTKIHAPRGFGSLDLKELWEYRELVYFMLWRQVKGDHRQMALGPLWIVLRPLLGTFLYTIVFGLIAKLETEGDIPYPLFNFAALLPWTLFATSSVAAANSLLLNRAILSKVYFPRLVVPLVGAISGVIHFLASFIFLLILMAIYGYGPSWTMLFLPIYVFLAVVAALAVGLWVAPWIVHYRDMANILDYGLLGWMYATPVVYAITEIPEAWRDLYRLNPMTNVVQGFRWALLGHGDPPGMMLAVSVALLVPAVVLGAYMFRRAERAIVDIA